MSKRMKKEEQSVARRVRAQTRQELKEVLAPDYMPAGEYFVGDLSTVMEPVWNDVLHAIYPEGNVAVDGVHKLPNGHRFVCFNGIDNRRYYDQTGEFYDVNGGMIGCVLLNDLYATTSSMNIEVAHIMCCGVNHTISSAFKPECKMFLRKIELSFGDLNITLK